MLLGATVSLVFARAHQPVSSTHAVLLQAYQHTYVICHWCFRIAVSTFQEKHGMKACMVAPTKIIAGLGMSLGIDRLHAPGTTGKLHSVFRPALHVAMFAALQLFSNSVVAGQGTAAVHCAPVHPKSMACMPYCFPTYPTLCVSNNTEYAVATDAML